MLFMVVETFTSGPDPVYERFAEKGRMLPDGLEYVSSWLDSDTRTTCFQLMRTEDPGLFEPWIAKWDDLVTFEITEVEDSPTNNR